MNQFIIQGLGVIAFIIGIMMYQYNNRRYILTFGTIYNLLYGLQYVLLGSLNGMLVCVIGAIRNIIFYHDKKYKIRTRYYILSGFIIVILITTLLNLNGTLSIFSGSGALLSTLALWVRKEKHIRIISLLSCVAWLPHDILIGSYAAILDGCIFIISILLAIYRFDIKGHKKVIKVK